MPFNLTLAKVIFEILSAKQSLYVNRNVFVELRECFTFLYGPGLATSQSQASSYL